MSSANNASSNNAMSICIPRAFENITEARVRKVFEALNIFDIVRIDMVKRVNEKGEKFQRIFVHIKTWFETADALKARERLLSGKELKIVYDDPWYWKASLNTWTPKPKAPPVAYDRKPKIRLEFEEEDTKQKNVQAAAQLLSSMTLEEDRRPYRERRVDPVYCEQDVKQGFRERRPRNRSRSPDDRYRRDDRYRGDDQYRGDDRYRGDNRYRGEQQRPRQDHQVIIPPLRNYRDVYPAVTPVVQQTQPLMDYRDGYGTNIYPAVTPVVQQPASESATEVEQVDVTQTASDPVVTEVVEVVEKPRFKPRAVETKEQKEKRIRAKDLLASHALSNY